jgi:predicted NBD/HSP70 family sugar kinase
MNWNYRTAAGCIVGIDLGGTSLRLARAGAEGEFMIFDTPARARAKEIITAGIRAIAAGAPVLQVGIARAPGIDRAGKINEWPSKPEWVGAPLLEWVREAAGHAPACSADDGLCAALWEHEAAGMKGVTACLSIGTGLAIGLVAQGEFVPCGDGAGTLSHRRFGSVELPCKCGQKGCLQTVLSVGGLQAIAATGQMHVLQHAFASFCEFVASRYGVNRIVITGGGVSRFGERFLRTTFQEGCRQAGIALEVSPTPGFSALGGAMLLAARAMAEETDAWSLRVREFIYEHSSCPVEA